MTAIGIVPAFALNSQNYQTVGDGVTDDTANIQSALNAAGAVGANVDVILTGSSGNTFLVSAPLVIPSGVRLIGLGLYTTTIRAASGFTGACILSLSGASYCGIRDMTIQAYNSTYSSNSAYDGIDMIGCTDIRLDNVEVDYVNGWGVNSSATASQGNTHMVWTNVTVHLSAQGFQMLGNSASSGVGLHRLNTCNANGTQNGDCFLIQDIHDILLDNCTGECAAGSGASLHVKGTAAAVTCTNCDFGPSPGPSTGSVVQISSDGAGSPKNITVLGGIIEGGTNGVLVSAGTYISLIGCRIFNNNTAGVNINDPASVHVIACNFNQNGSVAGTGRYDLINTSTAPVYVSDNKFDTPQGSGANQVNSCISDIGSSSGLGFYNGNFHNSTAGWTATNIYAGSVNPYSSTNVQGVGSVGNITAPTISGSPQSNSKSFPCYVVITGGTVSNISIGGVATGATLSTGQSIGVFVPAHLALSITYSVAPTWVWYAI